nr:1151_t:CDS:1 [Entrophospora candida]CAG8642904.1 2724_t:CDS:1 [Entrophospora candida]
MKFIFAFLLFATLSMVVNAIPHQLLKRASTFVECPTKPGEATSPLLTVTLSPDPVVAGTFDSFTISGALSRPIGKGDFIGVGFFNPATNGFIGATTMAPASPATPFSQVVRVYVPAVLPAQYMIVVIVTNLKTGIIGCASSMAGGSIKVADFSYNSILANYIIE